MTQPTYYEQFWQLIISVFDITILAFVLIIGAILAVAIGDIRASWRVMRQDRRQ